MLFMHQFFTRLWKHNKIEYISFMNEKCIHMGIHKLFCQIWGINFLCNCKPVILEINIDKLIKYTWFLISRPTTCKLEVKQVNRYTISCGGYTQVTWKKVSHRIESPCRPNCRVITSCVTLHRLIAITGLTSDKPVYSSSVLLKELFMNWYSIFPWWGSIKVS